jgi:hypothetical protein
MMTQFKRHNKKGVNLNLSTFCRLKNMAVNVESDRPDRNEGGRAIGQIRIVSNIKMYR